MASSHALLWDNGRLRVKLRQANAKPLPKQLRKGLILKIKLRI